MGIYINPGNQAFARIAGPDYVDKTGLIGLMNERVGGADSLVCFSRPRRFGKSYTAKMLAAYYDCSCDSHRLFDDRIIAGYDSYEEYINRYNVISLDITGFISNARLEKAPLSDIPARIAKAVKAEILEMDPEAPADRSLEECMIHYIERREGKPFIFIIDEWDAMIREAKDEPDAQQAYLNLLRGWFKNSNFTPKAVAAAYMTGILPIKKDGSQSAISDFREYSVIKPRMFAEFVGFTEKEVRRLCEDRNVDLRLMKQWYDGYRFKNTGSVYNPNSVMEAVRNKDFDSYWSESTTATELMDYISRPYNGLTRTVAELIGGLGVKVDTNGFLNDLISFKGIDDVLTLLIHLGYLAYDEETRTASIPNEEIRIEFQRSVHEATNEQTLKRLKESEQLFADTIMKNEDAVAAQIERVHLEETVALHYNKEDSLRSVIKLAYYTYRDHYIQFEELPAGEGFADVVYLPKRDSDWPALVIELKWNKNAEGAIDQILKKNYPTVIKDYGSRILLIGISYDKDAAAGTRTHTCKIVEYDVSK